MQPITLKLVLKGTVPSKKNNKINKVTNDGRPYTTTSKAFKRWYRHQFGIAQEWLERKQLQHPDLQTPITQKINFKVLFFFGDNRDRDFSNKLETIQDLLKDACVIYDDSYRILRPITADARYLKGVSRTEIYLTFSHWHHDHDLVAWYADRAQRHQERRRRRLLKLRLIVEPVPIEDLLK